MSRVAMLEQRVEELETALRLQALLVGRCLALAVDEAARHPMHNWLAALLRDARQHDDARLQQPVIAALLDGNVTAWRPAMQDLDAALAVQP